MGIVYSCCLSCTGSTGIRSEGAFSCRTSSSPSSSCSNIPGTTAVSGIGLKRDVFLVIAWLLVGLVAVTNVPFTSRVSIDKLFQFKNLL